MDSVVCLPEDGAFDAVGQIDVFCFCILQQTSDGLQVDLDLRAHAESDLFTRCQQMYTCDSATAYLNAREEENGSQCGDGCRSIRETDTFSDGLERLCLILETLPVQDISRDRERRGKQDSVQQGWVVETCMEHGPEVLEGDIVVDAEDGLQSLFGVVCSIE